MKKIYTFSLIFFKTLKILPLDKLIKYSNLKLMHSFAHGRLPFSFSEMWVTNRARNPELILRNADNYYVPAHKLASVKRFPYFSLPKLWNEYPEVKRNPNKFAFMKYVKSALLDEIVL